MSFEARATTLEVPLLKRLAQSEGKVLTFYDLETTTFLGVPTSGITEVAAVHVHPDGTVTQQDTLVNPENPISAKAAEVTGISQEMVDGQPHWGALARDDFHHWAAHHIMIGFNSMAFDNPYVCDQNARYGKSNTVFEDSRDVRSFWRLMKITENGRGKLGEIAGRYGLSAEGAHRAIYDVRMTARVLECMLTEKGIDFWYHPGGKFPAHKRLESIFIPSEEGFINKEEWLAHLVETCGYTSMQRTMMLTGMPEFLLSTMLGDLVMNDDIDYTLLEDAKAQRWLHERVPFIINAAWDGSQRGKLKAVFDTVQRHMALGTLPLHENKVSKPSYVDYLQLRVFLKAKGYFAAMDKSPEPGPLIAEKKTDAASG